MCTAISYLAKEHYFGRNLDVVCGYGEKIVIMPRNFKFKLRFNNDLINHFAVIGTAAVVGGYPLYFDAMNENGLCMAGLNFPNNAVYFKKADGKINITPFEFIPYILGQCKNISDVENLLCSINIVNENFSDKLPNTPLHWLISDNKKSITVESVSGGLRFYKNDVGVLTNNPPFLKQLENIEKYKRILNKKQPKNNGENDFSIGLDGIGIPGDYSSKSRFVKAYFVKQKSPDKISGEEAVNQFFHILSSVAMPKNCVVTHTSEIEYTRYTCCFDTENRNCYYVTYNNFTPKKVSLNNYDLGSYNLFEVDF